MTTGTMALITSDLSPTATPLATGDALELEGVTRTFGALRAIEDISFSVAAGERRAVIGANGAGKTTLVQRHHRRFSGDRGPRALLRRGHHRGAGLRPHPHGTAAHLPVVAAVPQLDGLGQSFPRRARRGARALRLPPAARVASRRALATDELLERVRLQSVAQRLVSSLSHGQQRQLEIGMALAGAPRLILFDEPAAGLSPGERRELVALLAALPEHMGFIIIEHDLDIALRVVEQVTVMHNGRVLKHGTPQQIESDAEVAAIYMGGGRHMSWFSRRRVEVGPGPILRVDRLNVYYGRAHARAGRLPHPGSRHPGRRRPQRHGQDDAVQRHHRAGGGVRQHQARRHGARRPAAARDHGTRHRLCAAGPPRLAVAHGRRASAAGRAQRPSRRLDDRAHLRALPAARRAARQRRLPALRRRAADAGDRPRAPVQSAPAGDGRADRGAGAGDRRAGRRDAEVAGRRCAVGPAGRAESRCRDRRRRHHRGDGQRPHRADHAGGGAGGGHATCSSGCWA